MNSSFIYKLLFAFSLFGLAYSEEELDRVKRVQLDEMPSEGGSRRARAGNAQKFPILLPYYSLKGPVNPDKQWGSCLLYAEGLSVIVNAHGKKPSSAVARIRGVGSKNTFSADTDISCPSPNKDSKDVKEDGGKSQVKEETLSFTIDVQVNDKAEAKTDKQVHFSVEGPLTIKLEFKTNKVGDWSLVNVFADSIKIKKGESDFLDKDLNINGGNMNFSRTDIGGFLSYSYACSSTPAAFLKLKDDPKIGVGISFDNFQFQPFGAVKPKSSDEQDKDTKIVRFGPKVNDCVGLFSIGSWMGIIVSVILFAVLIFGYLMLNSVQTMDRFDDPKQKQLMIGSKEQ